jgi:hypothetical protein
MSVANLRQGEAEDGEVPDQFNRHARILRTTSTINFGQQHKHDI